MNGSSPLPIKEEFVGIPHARKMKETVVTVCGWQVSAYLCGAISVTRTTMSVP